MAKKLMATLLVVAILFAAVPLSVSAADEYYTEKESNNSFVYANYIDSGHTVVGEIYSADKDFYAFRVPYTATVTVAAISIYGSLSLCLYNTNEVVAVAQNTGGIEEYWSYGLSCILEEGLYYLVFTDSQSYYMNTYAFAMVYERYDHTHSYTATTVAPTCTEQGYTEYTCACGDYYYDNYTDPTHTYSNAMDTSCNACDYVRTLSDGWAKVNGRWVYYQNGRVATNRWIKDSTGWCYVGADGYVVTDCWKKDSKGWCYLNQSGYMATNQWVKDSNGWCYVGADGYMVYSRWVKDSTGWCYVGASGYMVTNKWLKDSGGWCYVGGNGYMVTNRWAKDNVGWLYLDDAGRITKNAWVQDNVSLCYVGANGYMVTNKWMKYNGAWVYLDQGGHMAKSRWAKDSAGWCYLTADGYVATNQWAEDNQGWLYLNENGRIVKSKWIKTNGYWYYVGADGYMVTKKWVKDGSNWCYLGADGAMRTNGWAPDSAGLCYVDENGHMVTDRWVDDGEGWSYVDKSGHMLVDEWVKDSGGWCYVGEDGYMVYDTWVYSGGEWYYMDEDGHWSAHECDGCDHDFTEATYFTRAQCRVCGTYSGDTVALPIRSQGTAPFYVKLNVSSTLVTEVKIDNLYYTAFDNQIELVFDMQKTYDSGGDYAGNFIAARFKVYESDGTLLDEAVVTKSGYCVGDESWGEYVILNLSAWDGYSELILVVEPYR